MEAHSHIKSAKDEEPLTSRNVLCSSWWWLLSFLHKIPQSWRALNVEVPAAHRVFSFNLKNAISFFAGTPRVEISSRHEHNSLSLIHSSNHFFVSLFLVPLGPGDGLVLGLAGAPQEEGDAQGGEGHHGERGPVKLEK